MKQRASLATAAGAVPEPGSGTVLLMATAAGLFVASIYYNQPMLGILAREFGVGPDGVTPVAMATQIGYAAGLVLLASLGDCVERRRLIVLTTLGLAVALAAAALAPGLPSLIAASLAIGALATVAQQVVPMAAHLARPEQRGRVLGTVMAGLLSGILLARTISGLISELAGWREMFALASLACLAMGAVLAARLPRSEPQTAMAYPKLLASMGRLPGQYPVLRRAGAVQGLLFAGFVAFWATLALFLEQPPFSRGSAVAGLLGLLGLAGILAAPLAGRLVDRTRGRGPGNLVAWGAGAVAAAFGLMAAWRTSFPALCAGIVLMDLGLQAAMIANQARVHALEPSLRNRLNTVFVTMIFTGGAIGSAVSGRVLTAFGWTGVCAMGMACALAALGLEMLPRPGGRHATRREAF